MVGYLISSGATLCLETRHTLDAFWRHLASFVASSPPFHGVQWTCGQETARPRSLVPVGRGHLWRRCRRIEATRASRFSFVVRRAHRRRDRVRHFATEQPWDFRARASSRWVRASPASIPEHDGGCAAGAGGWSTASSIRSPKTDGTRNTRSHTCALCSTKHSSLSARFSPRMGMASSRCAVGRIAATVRLLYEVHDPVTGDVPNHGANDGAFVLGVSTTAM